jgi:mannose-6-phosphate isomerase-like protein (cupin superfamily)
MPIVNALSVKPVKINGPYERLIRVLLAPDTQDIVKGLSVSHAIISPHCSTDLRHTHPGVEMMFIMTGNGECTIGDETHKIGPNTLMICPGGIPHDIRNHSDEPMSLVAMFVPPETSKQIYDRAEKAAKATVIAT